jgi:cytochrome c oxidase subunit 2
MPPQVQLFYLYLVLAVLVLAVFLYVAWSTRRPRDVSYATVQRTRFGFFVLLVLVLGSALGLTLAKLPYERWEGAVPDRVVFVAGKQFAFAASDDPITTDEQWQARTMSAPVEVPAGSVVELRVTSFDVNHSVGLYDPAGVLVAQVQVMPGYVNRLRVKLDHPGTYTVLCLELCGNGHSRMRSVLQVKAPVVAGLERRMP